MTRLKLIGAALIAGVIVLSVLAVIKASHTHPPLIFSAPDLSDHPAYSKYDFGGDNVIDVGIQPLWIPASLITEAMKRDAVLREALAAEGLRVRFHPFMKGADVNFFLRRGDLQAAIGGDMPALTAAAQSKVVVAGIVQRGFCSVVARRFMLMEELRGRHVGYAFGSNAHYALLQALASAGLKETDVRMIPLDVDRMPDALNNGEIDAFSAWEPIPTVAITRFPDLVVIHRSLSSGYLYFDRQFSKEHPEAARHIVAAELRAVGWMRRSDDNIRLASRWALQAGKELCDKGPVVSEEKYVALGKSDLLGMYLGMGLPETDFGPKGRLFKEFNFLKGLGKIPEHVPWDDVRQCFDTSLVDGIIASGPKARLGDYRYLDEVSGIHESE